MVKIHDKRLNPFSGKKSYAKFARTCYSRLIAREWFSLSDVMADHLGSKDSSKLPYLVSKCDKYGELKKAFRDIVHLLEERVGTECIETDGNNRRKRFRYIGGPDNPLEDLQNSTAIRDIRTYAQFCEDSAGFFPRAWLDYFFEDTLDLLKIKKRKKSGEQFIASSVDRELTNIEWLPMLYEAIRDKRVLKIKYKSIEEPLIFHPHILKEYNGRWFLFGHAVGEKPELAFNIALDRLIEFSEISPANVQYIPAPKGFYSDFFKYKIGVSTNKDLKSAEPIIIRARNFRMYNLIETKKLHPSQTIVKPYSDYDGKRYGDFAIKVEVNNEFIGRILQMGAGLVVVAPEWVRQIFKTRTTNMAELYKD